MKNASIFSWTAAWLHAQGLHCEVLPITASTNDLAKANAFDDPPFKVYLAETQSEGRGRGTRTWTSPKEGSGLLITFSFDMHQSPQHLTAPLVGLHVYRALHISWPDLSWGLKAPNDIYLDGKKVCGILAESVSRGEGHRLIVGIGCNVFAAPKDIEIAGSLSEFVTEPISEIGWEGFLSHLLKNLRAAAQECITVQLSNEVRKSLLAAMKKHPTFANQLKEVTADGDLVFQDRTVSWHLI